MEMTLERSNSAETFSPPGGGTGLHLLSLWDGGSGLVCRLFAVFSEGFEFIYFAGFKRGMNNSMILADAGFLLPAKLTGTSYDKLCQIVTFASRSPNLFRSLNLEDTFYDVFCLDSCVPLGNLIIR